MVRSFRSSLRLALAVALLSPLLAASSARAGVFSSPLTDGSICGNIAVAATLGATTTFQLSTRCAAHCRQVTAACHVLVSRVASCFTTFAVDSASIATQNCGELHSLPCAQSVRANLVSARAIIVGERDGAFLDCDAWGALCQASCGP